MDTSSVMDFRFDREPKTIIKVIGIGGGGVNAVNYMYQSGIHRVNFAVCNTDEQSFEDVNVPVKITLGDGLGAGGKPVLAKEKFRKSAKEVETLLDDNTEMVFIAAGMGGGTGSGAAPLLAKMAKDKGKLTIGVVTIPFKFEKLPRITQALKAVRKMSKSVDSLMVINNEKLKEVYGEVPLTEAFKKPDEVLAMAVKSVAEIITKKGIINRDFNDVSSTMKDSGVALVSYGFGKGENRLNDAIQDALHSPLLNNNNLNKAKRILIYISFRGDSYFMTDELTRFIDVFMEQFDSHIKMIWGFGVDDTLDIDQEVKFTIIATGFGIEAVPQKEEFKDGDESDDEDDDDDDDEDENKEDGDKDGGITKAVKELYGDLESNIEKYKPKHIIVLQRDEMDNKTLLKYIEETPPYNRKQSDIDKLRKSTVVVTEEKPVNQQIETEEEFNSIVL